MYLKLKHTLMLYITVIVIVILSFQYGRTYDITVVVNQPEYNHIVKIDKCRIVTDTLDKPVCIWYMEKLYLPDPYQEQDNIIIKPTK